ncbi:GNAT family N-acetyltransferase [Nocardioides sp.]|uniref:GNAT family N-acetyltransferase n=1 Tax=Nocardioides sp. TaxID=35761 RepID=UPI002ED9FC73
MTDVATSHNPAQSRYEAHIDGELAGFAEYQLTDELVTFTHTEVFEKFEGKGVGSALARFGLDDVRASGERKVLPLCPFIKGWIGKHPDYVDLVYGAAPSGRTD